MSVADPIIVSRDLRKSSGSLRAVDGVSFEVAPGEVFGILGWSSSATSLRDVINDGAGLDVIGTDIIGLAIWAVIALVIATRLFKWE